MYIDTDGTIRNIDSYDIINGILTIPEGVRKIDQHSVVDHRDFNLIKEVELPSTMEDINAQAFSYLEKLERINLPFGLKSIQMDAFADCYCLTEIFIPDTVEQIGLECFRNCYNLERVVLSNNIKTLWRSTFLNCSSLTDLVIPNSVERIEPYCFENCDRLERIKMSNRLSKIRSSMFENCSSLEEILWKGKKYSYEDLLTYGEI